MRIKISNYKGDYRIVSLALDENTKNDLSGKRLGFIYIFHEQVILSPDDVVLSSERTVIEELLLCNNYDVFELDENGILYRNYNNQSTDNYFFMTEKCNSNCIMCPSSEMSREKGQNSSIEDLMELARHIPSNTQHLTITGGEPFLIGSEIFEFIAFLKNKFTGTDFLFLTNGRVFALKKYAELFCATEPNNTIVGIPLHGADRETHDRITRTNGSFNQTCEGVKRLLNYGVLVELRIVVSKMNINNIENLAKFIATDFPGVAYVCFIAMEMTGSAFKNKDKVWISYKSSAEAISKAVIILINHGINVKLYNFPLCTVDKKFWTLCEKSISPNKIRFAEVCSNCHYKDACGGIFAGTLSFEKKELEALI